jgi:hypothetical protein
MKSPTLNIPNRWTTLGACVMCLAASAWAQTPSPQPPSPDDTFHLRKGDIVLFLGDQAVTSKFYGQIFNEDMKVRYPDMVMRDGVLAKNFDSPNLKFFCGGAAHETVEQAVNSLQDDLLTFHPTVAVICYGQADWSKDPTKYEPNLRKLVKALRKANVLVTVMTPPVITKKDNPKKDAMIEALGKFAESARKIAMEENVGLAEAFTPTKTAVTKNNWVTSDDGINPNWGAMRAMADAVEDAWGMGKTLATGDLPRRRPWPKEYQPNSTQPAVVDPRKKPPAGPVRVQEWVNITGNVGWGRWGQGGVTTVAAFPGGIGVIAGVSESGWYYSTNGDQNWQRLGGKLEIKHRPYQIVFDPKEPSLFWVAGWSPAPATPADPKAPPVQPALSIYKTTDCGKTFEAVGKLTGVAGFNVDFSDTERKTMLAGMYDQPRNVQRSLDGGVTWQNIGASLPDKTGNSADVVMLDPVTYLVGVSASKLDKVTGIWRTEDGGKTWKKVCEQGPVGRPLIASDGTLYWGRMWSQGIVRSIDNGKTWQDIEGPAKKTPIEFGGGKLMSFAGDRLQISADSGKTWKAWGPTIPFSAVALSYSSGRNCIYSWWSSGDRKVDNAIWRLDLPDDIDSMFK